MDLGHLAVCPWTGHGALGRFLSGFGFLRVYSCKQKMTDSHTLLSQYARTGSESVFRELVSRYIDLVYSTAFRLVDGDAESAQDVAQTVFVALADQARTLPEDVMLGGWLHLRTRFAAGKLMRTERRRQLRERQAAEMNAIEDHTESNLAQVAPVLDDAIGLLEAEDRTAIMLRFFERKDFRGVGEALGSSEDAARKRVDRALEKLHVLLKHRGATLSTAALGTALATEAVTAAPAGLAGSVAGAALVSTAAGTGTTLTIAKLMATTKLKLGLTTLVIAGAATTLVIQHQSQTKLREVDESFRQQIAQLKADNESLSNRAAQAKGMRAPRLPAPPMHVTPQANASPTEDSQSTSLYARLNGKSLKLTAEQVESYLKANGRNPASLLAAFRTTGDPALLEEAMQKYPNDPQVDFEAVFKKDTSLEERRQWLDAFKRSAPDNALANYCSAFAYFKAGQTDQAVQDLIVADGKVEFQDYLPYRIQEDQEAYLSAGYSLADAEAFAVCQQPLLPQPGELRQFVHDIGDLAKSYQQAGDANSAQAALQIIADLGQRYANGSPGEFLVSQNVGVDIERFALGVMDPNTPYGGSGQTVQDQLNKLDRQLAGQKELGQQTTPLTQTMSDQDWISFDDRLKAFGEQEACRWLIRKYGQR